MLAGYAVCPKPAISTYFFPTVSFYRLKKIKLTNNTYKTVGYKAS